MTTPEVDREKGFDLTGKEATVKIVFCTKFARGVVPPTADGSIVKPCAGRKKRTSEFDGCEICGKRQRRQCVTEFADSVATCGCIALAELANPVIAPAFDSCIVEQCADRVRQGNHADDRTACTYIDRLERITHFACVIADRSR